MTRLLRDKDQWFFHEGVVLLLSPAGAFVAVAIAATKGPTRFEWSATGEYLLTLPTDGTWKSLRLHDAQGDFLGEHMAAACGYAEHAAWSPTSSTLAIARNELQVWRVEPEHVDRVLTIGTSPLHVAWSRDGARLAWIEVVRNAEGEELEPWRTSIHIAALDGGETTRVVLDELYAEELHWMAEDRWLLLSGLAAENVYNRQLFVLDLETLETRQLDHPKLKHARDEDRLLVQPGTGGSCFLFEINDGEILLWDLAGGDRVALVETQARACAWRTDGMAFATATKNAVNLWSPQGVARASLALPGCPNVVAGKFSEPIVVTGLALHSRGLLAQDSAGGIHRWSFDPTELGQRVDALVPGGFTADERRNYLS